MDPLANGQSDRLETSVRESTSDALSGRESLTEISPANGTSFALDSLDPEELYTEIVYNSRGSRSAAVAEQFRVLARPGESPKVAPRAGDILLRVALGEPGLGHVSVLSDSALWPHQHLTSAPFRAESQEPGFYAPVIESGAFPHTRTDPFARRILDVEGRLLPGQLLLSPRPSPDGEDNLLLEAQPELESEDAALKQGGSEALEEATYAHEEPALDEASWMVQEGAEGGSSSTLRQDIVEVAKREWERWDRGNRSETDPAMTDALQAYYARGVGGRVAQADLRNPTWQSRHPWSAVFISYVMREAGAGDAFAYARAHTRYIAAAKRAAQARDASKFQAFDITAARPEPGDLVCRDRQRGRGLPCAGTNFANVDRGGISHSDIVVEVHPGYIVALGGNTGQSFPTRGRGANTVGQKRISLDARGFVVPDQSRCRYFAIVKPPGGARPAPSAPASSGSAAGLPAWLGGAVTTGRLTLQAAWAMLSGQRDVNTLTNMIFYAQNPHLPVGYRIKPQERELAQQWLRIRDDTVRPLLRRLAAGPSGASATRTTPAPATGSRSRQGLPAGPLGTLTVSAPGRTPFTYPFSPDDLLWTARFVVGEAGGRDNAESRAVVWAMFNRYALLTHRHYPTFHAFLRRYSTPLQPVFRNAGVARRHMHNPDFRGTGDYYPGTRIPRGQLQRHLDIQEMRWHELPAGARTLAENALTGRRPNPGIGNATEFANTATYYSDRHGTRPSREQWVEFSRAYPRRAGKPWTWIGQVTGIDQYLKNTFYIQNRFRSLPPNSVRVLPPG